MNENETMTETREEAIRILSKLPENNVSALLPVLKELDKIRREKALQEFSHELDKAQAWAKEVGYKESDIPDIIKQVRRKRRACASS